MAIFEEFYVGSIDLKRLNYGIITLIPKVPGASDIRQFHPITVINVIFRILAKGYANRVAPLADRITHPNQSAFIQGRYILDGVLVFHEILHEVRSKNLKAVFLKIDFHNAYDTHLSGLRINFDKSEVMILGYSPDESQSIANRLNCRLGTFPTTYLGVPISDSHLTVADLRPSVLKLQHRIEPWQGRWLSKAARTILINLSLSRLLLFIMSFYSFPETLHHEIGSVQARFYWAGEGDKQKYHMVRWSEICKPRDQGGLGIMSSKRMNLALLTHRLWRIANGDGGLWLQIVRQKYLRGQPLAFCARTGGSQFWQSVIQLLPVLRRNWVIHAVLARPLGWGPPLRCEIP
ncbi:uncharacterized protein [Aegilops tauschii subsp. strangulata]|uniref:uncharacterized protein n=1 Tax=Aegilops tauschii subsp. strangulata TaxID=200361 RepID=UPI003CC866F7